MLEAAEKRGQPRPEWADDEPDFLPHEEYYIHAFSQLGTERQIGMSVGPIPCSAVRAYAKDTGFGEWEFLWAVISHADTEYLKDMSSDAKAHKSDKVH